MPTAKWHLVNKTRQITVTVCLKTTQYQGRQNVFEDWGEAREVLPLEKELLEVNGFWRRVNQFISEIWTLRS